MGNICRSPIAEHVLRAKISKAGLDVNVVSSGTAGWHIGDPADPRAAAVLGSHGYTSNHSAQQFTSQWFESSDLILVMDKENLSTVLKLANSESERAKVSLLRSYDTNAAIGAEVPDPYYGDDAGFKSVLQMIETACDGVVSALRRQGIQ